MIYTGILIDISMLKFTQVKEEEGRRAKVVEFIRNHQGCNLQALVNGVENYMSRVTAINVVHSLKKVDAIRINKDKPNSRDHKLFITADNLLVSVPRQLDEFEKAYSKLLDKSTERIRNKDFSVIAIELGISESDPSKWSEEDRHRYSMYEGSKMIESIKKTEKAIKERYKRLLEESETTKLLEDKVRSILGTREIGNHFISGIIPKISKIIMNSRELQTKADSLKSEGEDIIATRCRKDVSNFEVYVLLFGVVRIFSTMRDIIFDSSTIIWPMIVHDEQTLQQLYSIAYTKIAEIQLELTKFITSAKPLPKIPNIIRFMLGELYNPIKGYGNSTYKSYYGALNMQLEFESVIKCISDLGKELEQYGYLGASSFRLDSESSKMDEDMNFIFLEVLGLTP